MILQRGDELAGYLIDAPVGVGGMGMVYRATQLSLDRPVALKVLSPELAGDPEFQARFRREAKLAAQLDHPNIVPVFEAGEAEGMLFIAMRFVDGRTLSDRMRDRGLSPAETLGILRPVAAALDAAHDAGLVHRDVKPANILISRTGHPYLADFGIAKGAAQTHMSQTRGFLGSANYAAPEQFDGEKATRATDIYALTGILFHCFAGRVPFERESESALMRAHLEAPPPTLSEAGLDVPRALDDVMQRGLAKSTADRFPTAASLIQETERALAMLPDGVVEGGPLSASTDSGEARTGTRRERRDVDWPSRIMVPAAESLTIVDRLRPKRRAARGAGKPSFWDKPSARPIAATLLLAVAVAAGGAGYATTRPGDAPANHEARTAGLTLVYDSGWERVRASMKGLTLRQRVALQRGGRGAGVLVAGRLAGSTDILDPAPTALKRTWRRTVRPERVRLGGDVEALAYEAALRTGVKQVAFVARSSRGAVALACRPEKGAQAQDFFAACREVAGSLRLRGRPEPLGPDVAFARVLSRETTALSKARQAQANRLRSRSVRTRGHAARVLARAHRRLASRLREVRVREGERRAVARLLRAATLLEDSFGQLARAARRRSGARYERARRAVARADRRLLSQLRKLRRLGYTIR